MNLEAAISLYMGGPGSGCTGPNCGKRKDWYPLIDEHNRIKGHDWRVWRGPAGNPEGAPEMTRQYRMQKTALGDLVDRVKETFGGSEHLAMGWYGHAKSELEMAEESYGKGKIGEALGHQEEALTTIHKGLVAIRQERQEGSGWFE